MELKVASNWPDQPITIDGKAPEWAGREAYYDEKEGLKVGFFNDAQYVYIYLSTWHQHTQMWILTDGLTIWFDAEGGKREIFGVNYPLRRSMPAPRDVPREITHDRNFDSSNNNPERLKSVLIESRAELQIVGANREPVASVSAMDSSATDIEAMIDISNRTLIYELKVPLAQGSNAPFAINADPGKTIGVGFKVGKREMPKMEGMEDGPPSGMGDSPGGRGGEGGFPGGGMGGPGGMTGGMPGRKALEALELWFKVTLATEPPGTPQK